MKDPIKLKAYKATKPKMSFFTIQIIVFITDFMFNILPLKDMLFVEKS